MRLSDYPLAKGLAGIRALRASKLLTSIPISDTLSPEGPNAPAQGGRVACLSHRLAEVFWEDGREEAWF